MIQKWFLFFTALCALGSAAQAAPAGVGALSQSASALLKAELLKVYPGARVEVGPLGLSEEALAKVSAISLMSENGRGQAVFSARVSEADGSSRVIEGIVGYSAWLPARVALRRVFPGEKLSPDMFIMQDLNVATGQLHELRGVFLSTEQPIAALQSRQTILEGQPLLSSAIEQVPDVRRGDMVRIHMISNDLTLSTMGTAEEPGYLSRTIRVMASKTKHELVGQLLPGGIVEVKL